MELYKELLPSLGGYLTYAGDLDRRRLEVLVERIGQMELQTLEERAQVRRENGCEAHGAESQGTKSA